jgi:hypothetical protein
MKRYIHATLFMKLTAARLVMMSFTLMVLLFACKGKGKNTADEQTIAVEEMAHLLADIQLVESVKRINANEHDMVNDTIDYYTTVFDTHSVSRTEFQEAMDYYAKHPELLEQVYERVIELLSEREAGFLGKEAKK